MSEAMTNELVPMNAAVTAKPQTVNTDAPIEADRTKTSEEIFVLELKKPFEYCGKTYEKLTFDFDSLTGKDMIAVEREINLTNEFFLVPENSPNFCGKLAARAAGVSSDVIENLPLKDFKRAKEAAQNFLNGLELERA